MTPSSEEPSGKAAKPAARSRFLAGFAFLSGLLTVTLGLGLAAVGLGFANATACGTGAAAVFVGLWTMFAMGGVARRRLATFLGLGAAWAWSIVRVYLDLPATAASVMVLRDGKLDWDAFCRFQRHRIEYYQRRYHPGVYLVVCEPMTYHQFALLPDVTFSAEAWAGQLSAMCRLIKSIDPRTRTGICLLVMDDRKPEWEVWTRMRRLRELDILSVEIYEPKNFRQTQERLAEFGHPGETGKSFWIAETCNGWALCGGRRWDQDAAWLRVADGFARVVDAEAVLVWTFATFVPGGSFWDFGKDRLHARWGDGQQLSVVGQAFADLARGRK